MMPVTAMLACTAVGVGATQACLYALYVQQLFVSAHLLPKLFASWQLGGQAALDGCCRRTHHTCTAPQQQLTL
jgi:hypothetical protein